METRTIPLSPAQTKIADWLSGVPLVGDPSTVADLEHDLDLTREEAEEIFVAIGLFRLEGNRLTIPIHRYLLESLAEDCERFGNIEQDDGIDDRLCRGMTRRAAALDAAAKAKSAEALAEKLRGLLPKSA